MGKLKVMIVGKDQVAKAASVTVTPGGMSGSPVFITGWSGYGKSYALHNLAQRFRATVQPEDPRQAPTVLDIRVEEDSDPGLDVLDRFLTGSFVRSAMIAPTSEADSGLNVLLYYSGHGPSPVGTFLRGCLPSRGKKAFEEYLSGLAGVGSELTLRTMHVDPFIDRYRGQRREFAELMRVWGRGHYAPRSLLESSQRALSLGCEGLTGTGKSSFVRDYRRDLTLAWEPFTSFTSIASLAGLVEKGRETLDRLHAFLPAECDDADRRELESLRERYLWVSIASAAVSGLAQDPAPASSTKSNPTQIEVVRVGRSTYRLRASAAWRFVQEKDTSHGRFEVEGFEDIVVGRGATAEASRKDWENRLHAKFQMLYHLQNTEPLEPPADDIWEKLSHLIDVEAYRKSVSIVGREIGKVVRTGTDRKLIEWKNGKQEQIRYDRAPAELVTLAVGDWLQAMVARHPDTYKIRRILWLKPYTPWSGKLDDEVKARLEQIPTVASLPKTTWE